MNESPIVSVIIPVYNGEKTISETITSVLNQTFSDFELIIINDGSTDGTEKVVSNFSDKRIKLINIKNSGPSAARNKGMEEAKGEYVSFIDSDDLWSSDKIEKQLSRLKINDYYGVVYSWTIFIDENGKYIHPLKPVEFEGDVYEKLLINNFIGNGSNILVEKHILEAICCFDTDLNYGEEWDLLIRLSRKCKFALVKEYQIFYRRSINSLSSSIKNLENDSIKVIDKAYSTVPSELLNLKNKTLSNLNSYVSYLYLTRQSDENWKYKSISKLINSIKLNPVYALNVNKLLTIFFLILIYFIPSKYTTRLLSLILKMYGECLLFFKNDLKTQIGKNNLN